MAQEGTPHVEPWSNHNIAWLSLLTGLVAFIYIYLLTQHLFVFTEARAYIEYSWPLDLARFFVQPYLEWGGGRLTGIAAFQLNGRLCGTDAGCVQSFGAAIFAVTAPLVFFHTLQITRSRIAALGVAALWVLSPAALGIAMWQAARFDLLALASVLAAGSFWWALFRWERLTLLGAASVVIVSILLMALAFNSKEATYYLIAVMPLLAVGRAPHASAVRRNLVICAGPLVWALFYVVWALTHTLPAYADVVGSAQVIDKLWHLTTGALGIGRNFMFLWQRGPGFETLHEIALIGWVVLIVGGIGVVVLAAKRFSWRVPADRIAAIRAATPWLYLLGTIAALLAISTRSRGASVYYMGIPYWAFLTLGALAVQQLWRRLPRAVPAALVAVFFLTVGIGYLSHFTAQATYRRLSVDSALIKDVGASLRVVLADRPVRDVTWRTLALPESAFFITRGDAVTYEVSTDIWPWLIDDPTSRPTVTSLTAGSLEELRARVGEFAGPGQLLVVMSQQYDLLLVAYEGRVVLSY